MGNYYDLNALHEILSKLEDAGAIAILRNKEEINKILYPMNVTLESRVLEDYPTRTADEVREHAEHEAERQI